MPVKRKSFQKGLGKTPLLFYTKRSAGYLSFILYIGSCARLVDNKLFCRMSGSVNWHVGSEQRGEGKTKSPAAFLCEKDLAEE